MLVAHEPLEQFHADTADEVVEQEPTLHVLDLETLAGSGRDEQDVCGLLLLADHSGEIGDAEYVVGAGCALHHDAQEREVVRVHEQCSRFTAERLGEHELHVGKGLLEISYGCALGGPDRSGVAARAMAGAVRVTAAGHGDLPGWNSGKPAAMQPTRGV